MPIYQYRCAKCGEKFERPEKVKEHGTQQLSCPKCASDQVTQVLSAFYARTSKKS